MARSPRLNATTFSTAGGYLTISDVVMFRGILHCAVAYRCDHVVIRGKVARTNSFPCGAFRGFGAPQAIWGMESHMDAIAARIGKTPHALRLHVHARPGDVTPTGQILNGENGSTECLKLALKRSDFARKLKQASRGRLRKGQKKFQGIGLSFFAHGAAFTGDGEAKFKAKGRMELARLDNGKPGVNIRVSSTEMGQGVHTVFTQIAADALSLDPSHIRFPMADTGLVPNSGPTVASRTTMVVGNVVHRASLDLKSQIEAFASLRHFKGQPAALRNSLLVAKGCKPVAFAAVAREMLDELGAVSGFFEFALPSDHPLGPAEFQGRFLSGLFVVGQRRRDRNRSAHLRDRSQARHGRRRYRPRHQPAVGDRPGRRRPDAGAGLCHHGKDRHGQERAL